MNVSGVRFDKSCNWMGRGRGRYDKYYGKYGQECVFRVELTTEDRVEEELSDRKPHDIPMDVILTEKRVIQRDRCAVER